MSMNEIDHNEIAYLRHHLHAIAEVSSEEHNTSKFIKEYLENHTIGSVIDISETGFIWKVETGRVGPKVMFRAELDALPISEINDVSYRSVDSNVSHMCGHDGHMAVLIGTIMSLDADTPKCGTYYFLFQPAEETGKGALEVLSSPSFDIAPDFVFALHNLPGYPLGSIYCKTGSLNAAVTSVIISYEGKTSHAAEPENGSNPALAIANTLTFADQLQNANTQDDDFSLITPVHIEMGEKAYGVSAGKGEVHFTLRAWSSKSLETIKQQLLEEASRQAHLSGLKVEVEWLESFAATNNHPEALSLIEQAAGKVNLKYHTVAQPFKWGEDFGLFTEKFKGGFFGIGAGEEVPALHNPDYDFPDELIEPGVAMFRQLVDQLIADYE